MKYGVFFLTVLLAGCHTTQKKPSVSSPQPVPEPKQQVAMEPVKQQVAPTGSLFNPHFSSMMVSDRRAYRLGDILTVILQGSTDISMAGESGLEKRNDINIPDPTILGRSSATIFGSGNSAAFNFSPERKQGGKSNAKRTNQLKGEVAVRVVEVLPNGTLRVEGDKWLTINSNREHIRITGLVRPEDVKTDNTVESTRLAEAKVGYVALGMNADTHEPGWLTKMLNSPWFPF